jgi:hypothetical protein
MYTYTEAANLHSKATVEFTVSVIYHNTSFVTNKAPPPNELEKPFGNTAQKYLLKQQARSSLINKTSFDPKRYGKTCLLDRRATGNCYDTNVAR